MNSNNPIGGYFELELPPRKEHFHKNGIFLNSGRSCFAYALLREHIKKVYIPYYSCDSLLEPLAFHKIEYEFYNIDRNFEIQSIPRLQKKEKILYIDYYGLKASYARSLARHLQSQLIIDNTHNFYESPSENSATFYSPRKFFGIPDGGILVLAGNQPSLSIATEYGNSPRHKHLIGRIENGAQAHFEDYKKNEEMFSYNGIRKISNFSERLLASIDYENIRKIRNKNFLYLHEKLAPYNKLSIDIHSINGPLCYPLLSTVKGIRQKLIENLIFVPKYWAETTERLGTRVHQIENYYVESILPLPIDQRYNDADMEKIVKIIQRESKWV